MSRIIRAMRDEDFDEVAELEKSIFSIPWSKKSLMDAALTPENIYLVCREDDNLAGYCGMWGVLGEGNITNVAVSDKYRQQGVGFDMLSEMLKIGIEDKSIDVFFLEVRESNEAAKHLYEKLGFRSIGIRKNFYEKPVENALVMSKIMRKSENA